MIDLTGKKILITGASSGIGKSCAIQASNAGADVIITGRDKYKLSETYAKLKEGKHFCLPFNVTNFENIENFIGEIVLKTGKISGFIHCAGIEVTKPLQTMNHTIYEDMYSVNVISAFEFTRVLSKKKYSDEKGSSYVFISSVMGLQGQPGKVAYCSSKSALIGGAKSLALELATKSIRINCVSPGIVNTDMTKSMFASLPEESLKSIKDKHPLGFGEPADVANACIFLLSDLAKWITGTNLIIDGGYSAE